MAESQVVYKGVTGCVPRCLVWPLPLCKQHMTTFTIQQQQQEEEEFIALRPGLNLRCPLLSKNVKGECTIAFLENH